MAKSVILGVLERLQASLLPHSVVLTENFPFLCPGCLPAGEMRGVPAGRAGNDGLTVAASCRSVPAGRYRCFEHPFITGNGFAMVILGISLWASSQRMGISFEIL